MRARRKTRRDARLRHPGAVLIPGCARNPMVGPWMAFQATMSCSRRPISLPTRDEVVDKLARSIDEVIVADWASVAHVQYCPGISAEDHAVQFNAAIIAIATAAFPIPE